MSKLRKSSSLKMKSIRQSTLKQTLHLNFDQDSRNSIKTVDLCQELFKKFQASRMNKNVQKLNQQLKKYCGRNYTLPYREQYDFSQNWQKKKFRNQKTNNLQYHQYPSKAYYFVATFILILKIILMWCISIHKLFRLSDQDQPPVIVLGILVVITDGLMQYLYLSHYDFFYDAQFNKYATLYWKHLILIIYFCFIPIHYSNQLQFLHILDISIILLLKNRCSQITQCIRLQITSTNYKGVFNVIELFGTLLPVAHFFALMLYFVTEFNSQNNWLITHNLDKLQPIEKYVYSLYFTFTTMLTVGYGDISPVNIPQILMIMCVQVIGICTYGYILNEIGHILSNMRLEDQILSNDISTITKMAKYYDLDKGLIDKAKSFLVCRKNQNTYLTPEQQQKTLIKLQDDLREQICRQNSLRILKSSLFYVCNWTKQFQVRIAKKVHKKIFTPNQEIIQVQGKQKIYIFKKGRVQIHANRPSGYKQLFKKVLRTIEPNESMEVSNNIYGYSFIMSNSPIKLTALNKQFVVAYYVEGKDFLDSVMDSHLDRQYYYEMKTRIDLVQYSQSQQAPSIVNTKQHYCPSIQHLIKKYKNQGRRQKNMRATQVQMRRFRKRFKRKYYCLPQDMQQVGVEYLGGDFSSQNLRPQLMEETVVKKSIHFQQPMTNQTTKSIRTMKTFDNLFPDSRLKSVVNSYHNLEFKKQNLHYQFEQSKEYKIYFKNFNKDTILKKYEITDLSLDSVTVFRRRNCLLRLPMLERLQLLSTQK